METESRLRRKLKDVNYNEKVLADKVFKKNKTTTKKKHSRSSVGLSFVARRSGLGAHGSRTNLIRKSQYSNKTKRGGGKKQQVLSLRDDTLTNSESSFVEEEVIATLSVMEEHSHTKNITDNKTKEAIKKLNQKPKYTKRTKEVGEIKQHVSTLQTDSSTNRGSSKVEEEVEHNRHVKNQTVKKTKIRIKPSITIPKSNKATKGGDKRKQQVSPLQSDTLTNHGKSGAEEKEREDMANDSNSRIENLTPKKKQKQTQSVIKVSKSKNTAKEGGKKKQEIPILPFNSKNNHIENVTVKKMEKPMESFVKTSKPSKTTNGVGENKQRLSPLQSDTLTNHGKSATEEKEGEEMASDSNSRIENITAKKKQKPSQSLIKLSKSNNTTKEGGKKKQKIPILPVNSENSHIEENVTVKKTEKLMENFVINSKPGKTTNEVGEKKQQVLPLQSHKLTNRGSTSVEEEEEEEGGEKKESSKPRKSLIKNFVFNVNTNRRATQKQDILSSQDDTPTKLTRSDEEQEEKEITTSFSDSDNNNDAFLPANKKQIPMKTLIEKPKSNKITKLGATKKQEVLPSPDKTSTKPTFSNEEQKEEEIIPSISDIDDNDDVFLLAIENQIPKESLIKKSKTNKSSKKGGTKKQQEISPLRNDTSPVV